GGRVAERWGGPAPSVGFAPLGLGSLGASLATKADLALERVVLAPGDRVEGPALESRLVAVEAGTPTVAVDATSTGAARLLATRAGAPAGATRELAPGSGAALAPGDLVALPVSTSYVLGNPGLGSASLLVASFFPAGDPVRAGMGTDPSMPQPAGPWPPTVAVRPLAGGGVTGSPPGMVTAGMGRVILGPGAWLAAMTPGPLLAAVEAGRLDFAVDDGTAWVRSGATSARQPGPRRGIAPDRRRRAAAARCEILTPRLRRCACRRARRRHFAHPISTVLRPSSGRANSVRPRSRTPQLAGARRPRRARR
ncbi:MAG TPA: hypothetical protein VKB09_14205, partial [Thermomicrobiales bacterium]|nr:hypothetical protein [Thermomicrobiales bacterium]